MDKIDQVSQSIRQIAEYFDLLDYHIFSPYCFLTKKTSRGEQ
jgi:hypothetical protein